MPNHECVAKRQVYLNEVCSFENLPIRTRVYNHSLSLLGFVYERPCPIKNKNRYLKIDELK